jgi:hypothetical protein
MWYGMAERKYDYISALVILLDEWCSYYISQYERA